MVKMKKMIKCPECEGKGYIQSVDDEPNWPNEDEDDDYDQDIYIHI